MTAFEIGSKSPLKAEELAELRVKFGAYRRQRIILARIFLDWVRAVAKQLELEISISMNR